MRKLSRVFRREMDETEILTYMEGLRDLPLDRIESACKLALFRLKRMPMIADLRELANEKSDVQATPAPGKFCGKCYPDGWRKQERMDVPGCWFVVRCECQSKEVRG